MKKFFVSLICFLVFGLPAFCGEAKLNSRLTVSQAREYGFSGVDKKFPQKLFKAFKNDIYYVENQQLLKNKIVDFGNREVKPLENGRYSVSYKDLPEVSFNYLSNGNISSMMIISLNEFGLCRYIIYNEEGKLASIVVYPTKYESFFFDASGNLLRHDIEK